MKFMKAASPSALTSSIALITWGKDNKFLFYFFHDFICKTKFDRNCNELIENDGSKAANEAGYFMEADLAK